VAHTHLCWNGISMLWNVGGKEADFIVTTDVSGFWCLLGESMVPLSVVGPSFVLR